MSSLRESSLPLNRPVVERVEEDVKELELGVFR